MDEKGKEATQTTEGMQRDEGELTDQKEMGEEESECMHVEMLPNGALRLTVLLYWFTQMHKYNCDYTCSSCILTALSEPCISYIYTP